MKMGIFDSSHLRFTFDFSRNLLCLIWESNRYMREDVVGE
jgi:hypothetical protein